MEIETLPEMPAAEFPVPCWGTLVLCELLRVHQRVSPYLVPGSKNIRFNRIAGDLRLVNSSGTPDPVEFRYRDGLITKLIKNQSMDILRDFKRGRLSIGDLISADREHRLFQVSGDMKLSKSLQDALKEWYPNSAAEPASRKRYRVSWTRFLRLCADHGQKIERVADLADVKYPRVRRGWGASGADYNRARAAVSAFLTDFLGSVHHPFRLDVVAKFGRGKEGPGRVPTITAAQFWTAVNADTKHGAKFAAMAILGVGPKELRGIRREDLRPDHGLVIVNGTKAPSRQREVAVEPELWQWIVDAVATPLSYKHIRLHWLRVRKIAGIEAATMYDLRHLSGQLAGDAGMADSAIAVHLGHQKSSTTFKYTRRRTARAAARAIRDGLLPAQVPAQVEVDRAS